MPLYGQVVIGAPGAGKSTYCNAMKQMLDAMMRPCAAVNLDPANDLLPYDCVIDICELININDVMHRMQLGPNGGLVFCMDYIETKLDWLHERVLQLEKSNARTYLLIDLPGQVELFTHHESVKNIMATMINKWKLNLVCVYLVDGTYCVDPYKYIGVLLSSLSAMINLQMPQVNLLSKGDLMKTIELQFPIEFYSNVMDLRYLFKSMKDDPFNRKYTKLNEQLIDVIQDYGMLQFTVLDVFNKESMLSVIGQCDTANGYVFHETDAPIMNKHSTASSAQ